MISLSIFNSMTEDSRNSTWFPLDFPVFRRLKDLKYFKEIKIAFGTVQWRHEQDISPDTLFLEGVEIHDKAEV